MGCPQKTSLFLFLPFAPLFFLQLFLRLFFNQLLGGLRNSSTSYCAEGPAGGIPVHPLLFTRLRGTRLESTGTVFF